MGFGAVYALPMRLRAHTIGALNLFHRGADTVSEATLRVGQALADIATIAILQQRTVQDSRELSQRLQVALNSRVTIEQAKGLISGRLRVDMTATFTLLRNHARHTNDYPTSHTPSSPVASPSTRFTASAQRGHQPTLARPGAERVEGQAGSTAGFKDYWEYIPALAALETW